MIVVIGFDYLARRVSLEVEFFFIGNARTSLTLSKNILYDLLVVRDHGASVKISMALVRRLARSHALDQEVNLIKNLQETIQSALSNNSGCLLGTYEIICQPVDNFFSP